MNFKIFAFGYSKDRRPKDIKPSELFASLHGKSNLDSNELERFGIAKINLNSETYWAGILLSVRDSKIFTKITKNKSSSLLTHEVLVGEDRLADVSFFIASTSTGNGLIAKYHHSPSFNSLGPLLVEEFRALKDRKIKEIQEDGSLTGKERREKTAGYRGFLMPQLLVLAEDFLKAVSSLKSVEKVRIRVGTIDTTGTLLRGWKTCPKSQTVEYALPAGTSPKALANDLGVTLEADKALKMSVHGKDSTGIKRPIKTSKNPLILGEFDYDKAMANFELDLNNLDKSLQNAFVVHLLANKIKESKVADLIKNG
jgi:hypothetical protein